MSPISNEIARDEELDALNPLRHLMRHVEESDPASDPAQLPASLILPNQPPSIRNEVIHLSLPNDITISLSIDASPGCGGVAWPAGEILSAYIARKGISYLKDKTILELGSGTGLVGLVAGKLGGKVWISDQAPLLDIMRQNVAMNGLEGFVRVIELNWGSPIPKNVPRPEIILAADCVYYEPAFPLLVQTLSILSDEETDILFCYKKRRKADKRFFIMLKKAFSWTEVLDHPDRDSYSHEAISLLRLVKKQPCIR